MWPRSRPTLPASPVCRCRQDWPTVFPSGSRSWPRPVRTSGSTRWPDRSRPPSKPPADVCSTLSRKAWKPREIRRRDQEIRSGHRHRGPRRARHRDQDVRRRPNTFGGGPNTNITPTSLGLPGSLPALNEQGEQYATQSGLALGCEIAETCRFARKNYFYPDVPKDFQTSQSDEPIAAEGQVEVELEDGTIVTVPVERAHMEEDAGKNTHVGGATGRIHGADHS